MVDFHGKIARKMDDLGLPWIGNLHLRQPEMSSKQPAFRDPRSVQVSDIAPKNHPSHTTDPQSAAEMQSPLPALCQIDLRNKKHGNHDINHTCWTYQTSLRLRDFATSLLCRFAMS